jgi:dUTP pyrophosphatase
MDITGTYVEYGTGIAVNIPKGNVGLLVSRSSISETSLVLANGIGVIDEGYSGELKLRFKSVADNLNLLLPGDKVGQLLIVPITRVEVAEVNNLTTTLIGTARGANGFGSSNVGSATNEDDTIQLSFL